MTVGSVLKCFAQKRHDCFDAPLCCVVGNVSRGTGGLMMANVQLRIGSSSGPPAVVSTSAIHAIF